MISSTIAFLQESDVKFIFKAHKSRRVNFSSGKRLGARDHIVGWNKPQRPVWLNKAIYDALPDRMMVREMKKGKETFVTNLLDHKLYRRDEINSVYRLRWHIELDFRNIKQVMQMDIASCKTPSMVHKEIAAHLLAYNIVCYELSRAATHYHLSRRQLSFKAALKAINIYLEQLAYGAGEGGSELHRVMMYAISSYRVGNRPNRREPRAVKRRSNRYNLLTECRELARRRLYEVA